MDPLSVTASIISVLQLTTNLMTYLSNVQNASKEQEKLMVEASNLFGLLVTLRSRVQAANVNDPWFREITTLAYGNGPLDQFKKLLERLVGKALPSKNRKTRIKSVLLWSFTKNEVNDIVEQTERLKTLISLALAGDLFTLSQVTLDKVVILKEQTQKVLDHTQQLQINADQDLQDKLSRWLGIPDPSTNYHKALEERHPQTGLWLINGSEFHDWKSSSLSSFMWLHGSAGCGKTFLSATALESIILHTRSEADAAVAYFYFDFNDVAKQSPKKAVRSLLFQLVKNNSNNLLALKDLYQSCDNGQQQPAEDLIRKQLNTAVASRETYILLDALDECEYQSCEGFLVFLGKLLRSTTQGLHIIATSRRERYIEEILTVFTTHDINIESAVVDEDIRVYVNHQLDTDIRLKKWPPNVKEEIMYVILEKACGMFRWVHCQLEAIKKCVKPSIIRKVLSTLPITLDETYFRILRHLESESQIQDAITVLRWLCFSGRPITLTEMVEILAVRNGEDGGFDSQELLPDPNDIMTICSSLISCNTQSKLSADHAQDDSETSPVVIWVQLAHFSVKEYLLSDRCAYHSSFRSSSCYMAMVESCLHYQIHVCTTGPFSPEMLFKYPFAQYAAEHWWQYAQKLDGPLTPDVLELILRLLATDTTTLLSWVSLYNPDQHFYAPMRRPEPNSSIHPDSLGSSLYYAALLGLSEVVDCLMKQTIDINAEGGYFGNALQAASVGGNKKIVQTLIKEGVDPNSQGGYYGNALQAGLISGHEDIAQMLLSNGADVNAQGGYFGNALQAASIMGYEQIVQEILGQVTNIDIRGGVHETALQAASAGGYEKIVQMLLRKGADVNAQAGTYGNALQSASIGGHYEVVQILLDNGADVNAQGGIHCNALQAACLSGIEKVVQALLNKKADVNVQGGSYGTALQAASFGGHEKIVEMLLDKGADVNLKGGDYSTALQAASINGNIKTVQMLLDKGADANIPGGYHGNALQAASYYRHEDVVNVLLTTRINVDAEGGYFGHALQAASSQGNETIARKLLCKGADVNARGGQYGTALQAASYEGHKDMVKILLDAGADVNAPRGEAYGTALQEAAYQGHKEIVQMLLDAGAAVDAPGGEGYGNALQEAACHGHKEIVQILLASGADINAPGVGEYGTALQEASHHGYVDMIQMLLDAGADVNAPGGEHGTALQAANGNQQITQMLLDAGAVVENASVTHDVDAGSGSGSSDGETESSTVDAAIPPVSN